MKKIQLTLTPQQAAIVQIAVSAFIEVPTTDDGKNATRATAQEVLEQCHKSGADGHGRNAFAEASDRFIRRHIYAKKPKPASKPKNRPSAEVVTLRPREKPTG